MPEKGFRAPPRPGPIRACMNVSEGKAVLRNARAQGRLSPKRLWRLRSKMAVLLEILSLLVSLTPWTPKALYSVPSWDTKKKSRLYIPHCALP